jgi:hypothetical protein
MFEETSPGSSDASGREVGLDVKAAEEMHVASANTMGVGHSSHLVTMITSILRLPALWISGRALDAQDGHLRFLCQGMRVALKLQLKADFLIHCLKMPEVDGWVGYCVVKNKF